MKRIIALLCTVCMFMGFMSFANSESLISLSYLNNTIKPELQNIVAGKAVANTTIEKIADSAISKLTYEGIIKSVAGIVRERVQLKGLEYYSTDVPEFASMSRDEVISGLPGTTVVLKSGTASVANNTIINTTAGVEAKAGSVVHKNNGYFIPTSDGAGLRITSDDATVLVNGAYKIVSLRYHTKYFNVADALKKMNLFRGTNIGYELSRGATRTEGLVMLLRLLGEEDDAENYSGSHPFTDVPEWAEKYVAYAYAKGYTNGVSKTKFGASNTATAKDYVTFILRALGYDDSKGDFKWDKSLDFAVSVSVITVGEKESIEKTGFYRDQMAYLSYYSLFAKLKAQDIRLIDKLISEGAVNEAAAKNAISSVTSPRL